MTVGDAAVSPVNHLPDQVTQVRKEIVKSFPHSKRVGGYLLGQTLGVGSFAKVKEGLHLTTGEKVAVKIIDKKRAKTDNYVRKNLRREGKLLQLIRHPNVVSLLEVMETDNSYYLVTEICRGGDLMEYISARKRLPEDEVSRFVRQIVSAVDYLHRVGIIHRDLKIENLLLDENKNIKLIDFGLSNFIKVADSPDGTQAQEFCVTQCGSPAYAAPELLNHEKYGLQVDLWSIGVNMYAMLTGGLPFTVEPFNIKALYAKMRDRQMNPLPDGLSKECKDLLRKFLTPDPVRRVTITEALNHAWIMQGNKPVTRHPCPNRIRVSDLDADILSHMSDNLSFRMAEVIKFVTCNTPSPACATYHLFYEKLQRYRAETRQRSNTSTSVTSRSRSEDNRITLHLQDMCTDVSNDRSSGSSAPRGDLSTLKLQAITLAVHDGNVATSTTNNSRRDSSRGPEGSSKDNSPDKNHHRNTLARYGLINIDVCDLPTFDAKPLIISRPLPGVFKHSSQMVAKELFSSGKSAFEVVPPRVTTEHVDIGKMFIEKQIQNAKVHIEKNEIEHLKDKFHFTIVQSHSKNVVNPSSMHVSATKSGRREATSVISEKNWGKTSEEGTFDPKYRYDVNHEKQHQDIISDSSNHHENTQPNHSRRYIPNNRLLSRRGVIKTIDMNAIKIPDENSHVSSLNGGGQNLRTGSHPSPAFSKIIPKQFKPFRSAQDRPRLSENCPPHFLKQPQKAKTSESMILHGKNLLNAAFSEDFNLFSKCSVSQPPKPAVVRRKLAKRHRLSEMTQQDGAAVHGSNQLLAGDLMISDVIKLPSDRGNIDSVLTSSLPFISPMHMTT